MARIAALSLLLLVAVACIVIGTIGAMDVLAFDWSSAASSTSAPARDVVVVLP